MAEAKYILKIDPKLSQADAQNTERQLNSRFSKVANNYGEQMKRQNSKITDNFSAGMSKSFLKLKAGWLALAGIIASVLTSPFDEVDSKINELLNKVDNTMTRSEQWGVDPAKYLAFQQVAGIHGVDESMADNLLMRLADRLDQARTGEDDTLKNYLGETDIVEVAHKLFMTWNKMTPIARAGSMADIIGVRQANQFAELAQVNWNTEATKIQGGRNPSIIGGKLQKVADLEQLQKEKAAIRFYDYLMSASGMINKSTIETNDRVERQKQSNLLANIGRYQELASTEITQLKIQASMDMAKDGVYQIVDMLADALGFNGKAAQVKQYQQTMTTLASTPGYVKSTENVLPSWLQDKIGKPNFPKITGAK